MNQLQVTILAVGGADVMLHALGPFVDADAPMALRAAMAATGALVTYLLINLPKLKDASTSRDRRLTDRPH